MRSVSMVVSVRGAIRLMVLVVLGRVTGGRAAVDL